MFEMFLIFLSDPLVKHQWLDMPQIQAFWGYATSDKGWAGLSRCLEFLYDKDS